MSEKILKDGGKFISSGLIKQTSFVLSFGIKSKISEIRPPFESITQTPCPY